MHHTNVGIQSRAKPVSLNLKSFLTCCILCPVSSPLLPHVVSSNLSTPRVFPVVFGWGALGKPWFKQTIMTVNMPVVESFGFILSESNSCSLFIIVVKTISFKTTLLFLYGIDSPKRLSISLIDLKMAGLNKRYFHFKILGFSKVLCEGKVTKWPFSHSLLFLNNCTYVPSIFIFFVVSSRA